MAHTSPSPPIRQSRNELIRSQMESVGRLATDLMITNIRDVIGDASLSQSMEGMVRGAISHIVNQAVEEGTRIDSNEILRRTYSYLIRVQNGAEDPPVGVLFPTDPQHDEAFQRLFERLDDVIKTRESEMVMEEAGNLSESIDGMASSYFSGIDSADAERIQSLLEFCIHAGVDIYNEEMGVFARDAETARMLILTDARRALVEMQAGTRTEAGGIPIGQINPQDFFRARVLLDGLHRSETRVISSSERFSDSMYSPLLNEALFAAMDRLMEFGSPNFRYVQPASDQEPVYDLLQAALIHARHELSLRPGEEQGSTPEERMERLYGMAQALLRRRTVVGARRSALPRHYVQAARCIHWLQSGGDVGQITADRR